MIEDASTGLAMYRAGQLDCGPMDFWSVRQPDLEALQKSHPHLQYQDGQASGGTMLALRTDLPPSTTSGCGAPSPWPLTARDSSRPSGGAASRHPPSPPA